MKESDFATRHVMCSTGVMLGTGVRTIYKHASDCQHQNENVEPEAERAPHIPPQDTARDMWLLATPPIGQSNVNAEQYEELRMLALKLANRALPRTSDRALQARDQMKKFPYRILTVWSDDDECYVARVPAFPNLAVHGDTVGEAASEAQSAAEGMLEFLGDKAPDPTCHYANGMSDTSVACGSWGPNEGRTNIFENVTCKSCLSTCNKRTSEASPGGLEGASCTCGGGLGHKPDCPGYTAEVAHVEPRTNDATGIEETLRWYATVPRDADGATMPLDLGERARRALGMSEPEPEQRTQEATSVDRCTGVRERAKITHVACKDTEGVIWSLPSPYRHHHVFRVMHDHGAKPGEDIAFSQGFLDAHGHYLTRKQAMVNASKHNQIKNGKIIGGVLTSEDLW